MTVSPNSSFMLALISEVANGQLCNFHFKIYKIT